MTVFACDVSEFQPTVNDTYPFSWLIFRSNDGTYRDQHFPANYQWAQSRAASGRIAGYTVYCVYRPGVDVFGTLANQLGHIDAHVTVMVDVESWGGDIRGDHSDDINALLVKLYGLLGDRRRILAYGNQYDLASIYPRRPSWLRLIVAAYGADQPTVPNMIGWQYTDDHHYGPASFAKSTPPFGACDHNAFPNLTPAQLAAALGVGAPQPAAPPEVAPMFYVCQADKATFPAAQRTACFKVWATGDGAMHATHITSVAEWQALLRLGVPVGKPITYNDAKMLGAKL